MASARQPAVVTGASTGIGLELAKVAAARGFDLVIAADQRAIRDAAEASRDRPRRRTPAAVLAEQHRKQAVARSGNR